MREPPLLRQVRGVLLGGLVAAIASCSSGSASTLEGDPSTTATGAPTSSSAGEASLAASGGAAAPSEGGASTSSASGGLGPSAGGSATAEDPPEPGLDVHLILDVVVGEHIVHVTTVQRDPDPSVLQLLRTVMSSVTISSDLVPTDTAADLAAIEAASACQ